MKNNYRCDCAITSALDIVGDKWTLVIVKQMLLEGKKSFKDFLESAEGIASNILSSRLKMLESYQMIRKDKLSHNKKTNIYILTKKGIELAPILVDLALWSDNNLRDDHLSLISAEQLKEMKDNKEEFTKNLVAYYRTENWA